MSSYYRPEGTSGIKRRHNLKHKAKPYTKPRSWAGLEDRARQDLERNKRLLG
jgi:hypothetical protein